MVNATKSAISKNQVCTYLRITFTALTEAVHATAFSPNGLDIVIRHDQQTYNRGCYTSALLTRVGGFGTRRSLTTRTNMYEKITVV